ncbi:MAG TPA: class I SAM-dependent methyltransferase [Phototrophicaceae bacterium]|nr:class I SAM-dependent methyltransferase [Phototrophicaceae bacterium]
MVDFPETADIETASEDYARRFSGAVGAWFLNIQTAATLKMLADYPCASVLDVGGGHGQIAGALADHEYQVTVLGSTESCSARIQDLITARRVTFQVGNVLDIPYPDQHFDVVISYRLLPHVTQWEPFLAELTRVARQTVVLDYPEVQSINYIAPYLFRFKKQLEGNTRTYTCFKQADLLRVFQQHGFTYADVYKEFFFPMVLHRKLQTPGVSSVLETGSRALRLTSLLGSPVILKVVRENPK